MFSHKQDHEIEIRRDGPVVHVTLNRPKALNALTLEMIRILTAGLEEWEKDDGVAAIIVTGAGDRAFCAGGDIKTAYRLGMSYRQGKADARVMSVFFGEEYRFNRRMFHFKKPIIALMGGITMGGGFGVAGPCKFRVATEDTVFAMPETGIGFFPDIGSAYFLNRAPRNAGLYLGLTGNHVAGEDMLYCGLASHYVAQSDFRKLSKTLSAAVRKNPDDAVNAIEETLNQISAQPPKSEIERNIEKIESCFDRDSVEQVIEALRLQRTIWCDRTADLIETRSPTSLKVTLMHLKNAHGNSFDEVTATDFMLCQHFLMGHDFYEGVRAMVIDKDRAPKWDPARLQDIAEDSVMSYFMNTGVTLDNIVA